ncbi:MAG: hypothetical protein K6C40_03490 [Thermoguttaceae bacterium]|nr:hypothetical protein [Thermoguttaceae bacterium]
MTGTEKGEEYYNEQNSNRYEEFDQSAPQKASVLLTFHRLFNLNQGENQTSQETYKEYKQKKRFNKKACFVITKQSCGDKIDPKHDKRREKANGSGARDDFRAEGWTGGHGFLTF